MLQRKSILWIVGAPSVNEKQKLQKGMHIYDYE